MIAAMLAIREPAMFALTPPTIWITIGVYHDEGGEEHVAIARIAAWHEDDARSFLEDRLLEDTFGVPADEIRGAWENDEDGLSERLWISELLAISTDELNAGNLQGTPAARRAYALATDRPWDGAHAPTP
ncbi:MAG: hypothetical protein ABIY55_02325 [Kofleriaceae bacterium]